MPAMSGLLRISPLATGPQDAPASEASFLGAGSAGWVSASIHEAGRVSALTISIVPGYMRSSRSRPSVCIRIPSKRASR